MTSAFDPRAYAFVDRLPVPPLLTSIVGEPDELERAYLFSEGAASQTKEDPGPDYWKACTELGSWFMHWMTTGWFQSWAIHLHQERRPCVYDLPTSHLALCSTVTVSWTAFDPVSGSHPISLQYVHWLLDPDAMSMLVWHDDPHLSPNGLGRAMATVATDRMRQYLRAANLESLGVPAWSQPIQSSLKNSPIWPTSWSPQTDPIFTLTDNYLPETHPQPTSKSWDSYKR